MSDIGSRLSDALADRYSIERELGGGGMSRVFLAEEVALGRKVVLKVLPPELAATVNVERFRREIHLAASLQHPHIVPLLAAGSADGLLYYTMPLVEGESLRAKLARERELPINETIKLLRDVADALACAHERGVLHRDIKPDNILISRHHALVADFGVAKALSTASGGPSGTTEGVALGTPAYMAPEQAAADPHIDHRADLYALGVVGYEMLTGNTPFPGLTGQAALAAHVTKPAPPVTDARSSVPAALANLIMRCLEKHPADRPQSAEVVLQQLDDMTTPSGGTSPAAAVRVRTGDTRGRRRLVLAGILAVAVVGLSAVFLSRSEKRHSLEPNLLAVAPFDVLGGDLQVWKEGLVDLLSRNLDGAGPLRTVAPSIVIRQWTGRADPASAATLGRGTGAGLTVFGNLVAVGSDSLRLSATILDVARDKPIGEVQLRGSTLHMDQLSDSLTVSLLKELGRSRDIAVSPATSPARSLPALKAFLDGERLYRRGEWDSAQAAYRRTLALDSTFVPALRHLGHALWWRTGDASYVTYLLRAGELNQGLSQRDSLMVAADSLYAALANPVDLLAEVRRSLTHRLLRTLEHALTLYPEDPEIWYQLGEVRYHNYWMVEATVPQMLDPFDRSIALDSGFTPSYHHALDLGLLLEGLEGWDRFARPYFALRPEDDHINGARLLDVILKSTSTRHLDSVIRSVSGDQLSQAVQELWDYTDSSETAIRLARALVEKGRVSSGIARYPHVRSLMLAWVLGFRGHFQEARELMAKEQRFAVFAALPGEVALVASRPLFPDSLFSHWLRERPLWPDAKMPPEGPPGLLMYALPWWAARRDTLALAQFIRRADSAHNTVARPLWKEMAQYFGQAARAYSTLARGDTAEALRRLQELPDDVWWGPHEQVTKAQILVRQRRDAEALELFETAFPRFWWGPARVLAMLEAGEAAERLGDHKRARASYQFVADAWRHADPELQSYVTEARHGLARLAAEPRD